jgi:drug/metabolite transporter (DMT)-like permease
VGQVQLTQPLLTLLLSALVLGESLTPTMLLAGAGVLVCVAATQRARVAVRPSPRTPRAGSPEPARART